MAARASISRTMLNKVEKGDPGVGLGTYATVLFVLGLAERLGELADVRGLEPLPQPSNNARRHVFREIPRPRQGGANAGVRFLLTRDELAEVAA